MQRFIKKNMAYAAVDLGTNALRLLILDEEEGKILKRSSSIVGLGSYLNNDRELIPPKKYYEALDKIFKEISNFKVKNVCVVGTSIFRDCINKKEIKDNFYKLYRNNLTIISPKKEASLTSAGALSSLSLGKKAKVVVDIGGGSTEIVYSEGGIMTSFVSMPLGVVREFNTFGISENFTPQQRAIIFEKIEKKINKYSFFNKLKDNDYDLVMNGGTPTTLAAIKLEMKKYNSQLVNGQNLKLSYIKKVHNFLFEMSPEERLKLSGMEKGREVVIIYGIFILLSILKILNRKSLYVSDSGILEGIMQEID